MEWWCTFHKNIPKYQCGTCAVQLQLLDSCGVVDVLNFVSVLFNVMYGGVCLLVNSCSWIDLAIVNFHLGSHFLIHMECLYTRTHHPEYQSKCYFIDFVFFLSSTYSSVWAVFVLTQCTRSEFAMFHLHYKTIKDKNKTQPSQIGTKNQLFWRSKQQNERYLTDRVQLFVTRVICGCSWWWWWRW